MGRAEATPCPELPKEGDGVFAKGFNNLSVALAGSFRHASHILQQPFP